MMSALTLYAHTSKSIRAKRCFDKFNDEENDGLQMTLGVFTIITLKLANLRNCHYVVALL